MTPGQQVRAGLWTKEAGGVGGGEQDKGVSSLSRGSGAGCVYGAVSPAVRPLPWDTGHQADEKIIAPSVSASRDSALIDTSGN